MTNPTIRSEILTLMLAIGVAACAGDATGPADDPGPALESRWDMNVTVRYVRASSELTCDGETLVGTVNPGEYQYRITASYGGASHQTQSKSYGSVSGTSYELGRSEIYNFANETWSFANLREGESVRLRMYSTEWDGPSKDDYMNNRSNTLNLTPSSLRPAGGTSADRALGVGKATCGLTLYYDVTIVQRQVEVG